MEIDYKLEIEEQLNGITAAPLNELSDAHLGLILYHIASSTDYSKSLRLGYVNSVILEASRRLLGEI